MYMYVGQTYRIIFFRVSVFQLRKAVTGVGDGVVD